MNPFPHDKIEIKKFHYNKYYMHISVSLTFSHASLHIGHLQELQ